MDQKTASESLALSEARIAALEIQMKVCLRSLYHFILLLNFRPGLGAGFL